MKNPFYKKNRLGFAFIPVILAILLGGTAVIGGSVLYGNYSARQDAGNNQISNADKAVMKNELDQFFNQYKKNCFSLVSSIGNRHIYQKALDDTIVAYAPSRKGDFIAKYDSAGVIFLGKPFNEIIKDKTKFRITLWHELTHTLEVANGDRWSRHAFMFWRRTAYNERHAEYIEAILSNLNQLILLEDQIRKTDKRITAKIAKKKLELIQKSLAEGSANQFEKVPSDLKKFASYSGFDVNFNKILKLYKDGTCIKFPEETFEEIKPFAGKPEVAKPSEKSYVVWEGINASVGIIISDKERYEKKELAKNFSGGGIDPKKLLDKKLLSSVSFKTFAEAEKWICGKLTDIKYAPLGVGWVAKYNGRGVLLGNTSCGK